MKLIENAEARLRELVDACRWSADVDAINEMFSAGSLTLFVDLLTLTGGAIGQGMPVATGAAVACPDRPVLNLQADGSAMYTLQSLWTQARENLDVTTVIFDNRSYAILSLELSRVGARTDGYEIRRAAVMHGIPCLTTLSAGVSAARAIASARRDGEPEVLCLQELHGVRTP